MDRETRPGTACGTSNSDGLHMTVEDFEALDLHAATLPSIQRVTSECSFWNPRKDTLCKSSRLCCAPPAKPRIGPD